MKPHWEDEEESDIEMARRRAPIQGEIPGQEIPFEVPPCETPKQQNTDLGVVFSFIGVAFSVYEFSEGLCGWYPIAFTVTCFLFCCYMRLCK